MERWRLLGVIVAMTLPPLVAAPARAEDKGPDRPMGNCSDVVFHEKSHRLFVAGGAAGVHVLEVKDGNMSFVTTVADGGAPRRLALSGDRLYAADVKRGLVVLDVAGDDPISLWKQENGQGLGVSLQDHYAYLAAGAEGLCIFDLSAVDAPKLAARHRTGARARDVWVNGKYACVADEQQGLAIIDVSVPLRPQTIALAAWDRETSTAQAVWGQGAFAYVAAGRQGLVIVNVENPSRPTVISRYKSHPSGFARGLCARQGFVYLTNANGDSHEDNGLSVIDVRDPKAPKVKGKCALAGNVEGICLGGRYAFVANTLSGVRSIDISDPNHPRLAGSLGSTAKTAFLETEPSSREREMIAYLEKTRSEVLQGRPFTNLSTPAHTLLTVLSALAHQDPNALKQAFAGVNLNPLLLSPEMRKSYLAYLGKCTIARIEMEDKPPQESDLGAIYTQDAPGRKIGQVWMFAYMQGAWRLLTAMSDPIEDWQPSARQIAGMVKGLLPKETTKSR